MDCFKCHRPIEGLRAGTKKITVIRLDGRTQYDFPECLDCKAGQRKKSGSENCLDLP
jgi:hypothetical protein